MYSVILVALSHNLIDLLGLTVIYEITILQIPDSKKYKSALAGFSLGLIGVIIMELPWEYEPGLFFDMRSVIISIGSAFFGLIPATIAVVMTATHRILQGGLGMLPGIAVILTSALLGLGLKQIKRNCLRDISFTEFWIFGMVVHIVMLLCMFLMPFSAAMDLVKNISAPVLLVYPLGTVLAGSLLQQRLNHNILNADIRRQKALLNQTQHLARIGGWEYDVTRRMTTWTDEVYRIYGVEPENFDPNNIEQAIQFYAPDDQITLKQAFDNAVHKGEPYDLKLKFVSAKGKEHWVRTIATVKKEAGEVVKVTGHIMDISAQKEGEQRVRESSEKYEALFQNMLNGFAFHQIVTDDKGRAIDYTFVEVNSAFENLTGLKREKILGRSVTEVLPEIQGDPADWIRKYGEVALKGKELRFEQYSESMDTWFSIHAYSPSRGYFATIFEDITERKKANEQLNNILENSTIMFYSHTPEHVITFVSPQVQKLLGYTPEEARIKWTEMASDNPINDAGFKHTVEAIKTGKPQGVYELELVRKDGERIIVEVNESPVVKAGKTVAIVGSLTDITERRMTELEIKQSEEKYRMIVENAHDGIEITQDDRFIFINSRFAEMLGYSVEELLNTPMSAVFTESAQIDLLEREKARNSGQSVPNEYETTFYRKDKTVIDVHVRYEITDYQGKPATFAIIGDITAEKQAAVVRAKLETQLRQSQKLETVGTMAGGIAHDFNNILQGLFLYTSMIKDQLPEDKELQANFQRIIDSGEQAKHLVNQILTFSRKQNSDLKATRIQYLLKEDLKLIRAEAPGAIEIKDSIDTRCSPILCDPTQIHQVFVNLCNNALQAMETTGGTLSISLKEEMTWMESADAEKSPAGEGVVALVISDTGVGMEAETQEHMFDPFFTTKKPGQGTGLGLSIVHRIITEMHGRIKVESELGLGSTITILFPATSIEETENVPAPANRHSGKLLRILFVYDDEGTLSGAKLILEKAGHAISLARNGSEALKLFEPDPAAYDLILTDLSMPEMTGIELGRAVRKLSKDVLIILTSGNLNLEKQSEYASVGFSGFINKPWTPAELLDLINSLIPEIAET